MQTSAGLMAQARAARRGGAVQTDEGGAAVGRGAAVKTDEGAAAVGRRGAAVKTEEGVQTVHRGYAVRRAGRRGGRRGGRSPWAVAAPWSSGKKVRRGLDATTTAVASPCTRITTRGRPPQVSPSASLAASRSVRFSPSLRRRPPQSRSTTTITTTTAARTTRRPCTRERWSTRSGAAGWRSGPDLSRWLHVGQQGWHRLLAVRDDLLPEGVERVSGRHAEVSLVHERWWAAIPAVLLTVVAHDTESSSPA